MRQKKRRERERERERERGRWDRSRWAGRVAKRESDRERKGEREGRTCFQALSNVLERGAAGVSCNLHGRHGGSEHVPGVVL
jgi:hypothetical protein